MNVQGDPVEQIRLELSQTWGILDGRLRLLEVGSSPPVLYESLGKTKGLSNNSHAMQLYNSGLGTDAEETDHWINAATKARTVPDRTDTIDFDPKIQPFLKAQPAHAQ
jgi:hypothetical protein